MDENPKRPQKDRLAFLRNVSGGQLRQASRIARFGPEAAKEMQCEDFFNKFDLLLPTHSASHHEMRQVMDRMIAGRPNLPQDGR